MFTWLFFPVFSVITEDREDEKEIPQIEQTGNFVNNTYPEYIHIYMHVHVCMHMCMCMLCMFVYLCNYKYKANQVQ